MTIYRMYPQLSYDILEEVDFPWPIAKIALQHRECYDGSGFPHGMKGEDILIEARILAVADAVEDLTSHRAYRKAFLLSEALEIISSHSGSKYDPEVVAACLKLFKEGVSAGRMMVRAQIISYFIEAFLLSINCQPRRKYLI